MNNTYELIIFDLDGTILDTLEDLMDATNHALETYYYPTRTLEEVRSFVGNGLHRLAELAVPANTDKEKVEAVYEELVSFYQTHCDIKTKPYDGICEVIKKLKEKGCKTAIVSNKADAAVQILKEQYFPGLFEMAVGENEKMGIKRKPAPDTVYTVLEHFKVEKANAVYIGDSEVDLATASNAGIDCIAVSYGFRGKEFLEQQGALLIADTPLDILVALNK